MAESRPVPCNLHDWPRVSDLLPDQKHIHSSLWFSPDSTPCGCFALPIAPTAARLSLSAGALQEALREFQRRKLIALDEETGEIFLLDWFRFHRFATPKALTILSASVKKIISPRLRHLVLAKASAVGLVITFPDKSISSIPTATATSTLGMQHPRTPGDVAAAPKKKRRVINGVTCWDSDDRNEVARLVQAHGIEAIQSAADSLHAAGTEPLPGRVAKRIEEQMCRNKQTERVDADRRATEEHHAQKLIDEEHVVEAGSKIIERIRSKRLRKNGRDE